LNESGKVAIIKQSSINYHVQPYLTKQIVQIWHLSIKRGF